MRHALALVVATLALLIAAQAHALDRPLSQVVRAIQYSNPHVSKSRASVWARVIRREAIARSFDPLTQVAIVDGESNFNPSAVHANPPREYSVGLNQINVLANRRACQPPTLLLSPGCQAAIASLMDARYNLKVAAAMITSWRKHCRKRTGRPALFARWLSGFQGYDSRRGVVCNQRKDRRGRWRDLPVPKKTRAVMRYRRELIRVLT